VRALSDSQNHTWSQFTVTTVITAHVEFSCHCQQRRGSRRQRRWLLSVCVTELLCRGHTARLSSGRRWTI